MAYSVGDKVKWTSSNTDKIGEIMAVVPAGSIPSDVGFPKVGGGGSGRDHVTYVCKGRKHYSHDGKPYGSNGLYWPHVSLLSPA